MKRRHARPSQNETLPTLRLVDGVLAEIEKRVAGRPPERGGVLLGFGSYIHAFLDDDHGDYSGGHWDVSSAVVDLCREAQLGNRGTYVGQLHSHPDGMPDPSTQDRRLMLGALPANPHRQYLILPVVSRGRIDGNLSVDPGHQMSFMAVVRVADGPAGRDEAEVLRLPTPIVVPLSSDLTAAGLHVGWATSTQSTSWRNDLPGVLVTRESQDWLGFRYNSRTALLVGDGYPEQAPRLLTASSDELQEIQGWDANADRGEQLRAALRRVSPVQTMANPEQQFSRVMPLVGDLSGNQVLIAGAGSVGSRMAEDLCRAGVDRFVLVDPDEVTAPNLGRTIYTSSDVGRPKVSCLSERLSSINSAVEVIALSASLGELDLGQVLKGVDLVVGATDDMDQQLILGHHAFSAGVPMVCCALYRRAAAGEVVLAVPVAATACIRCALADVDPDVRPDKDYGTGGRLVAEPGLGPSIQLVASFASLQAIGLLAGPSSSAGRQVKALLNTRRTYGKIAVEAEWDFFPSVLGHAGHQHAPQSVWITVHPSPSCGVCGEVKQGPMSAEEATSLAAFIAEG